MHVHDDTGGCSGTDKIQNTLAEYDEMIAALRDNPSRIVYVASPPAFNKLFDQLERQQIKRIDDSVEGRPFGI